MKDPKVGERVAVYDNGHRSCCSIKSIYTDGTIVLNELSGLYHPKQCRRLIKKKRREFWIFVSKGGDQWWTCESLDAAKQALAQYPDMGEVIHVREVRK